VPIVNKKGPNKIIDRLRKGAILKRKIYSKELKSKVALAATKGNQTVNEID